jgi:uncharacterized membrane protein YvbJ
MRLKDFECPNCGAHDMETGTDLRLTCDFCGSIFGQVTRICPRCGHYHEEDVRHCAECGAAIVRDCPACGADNWTASDHCVQCGRNLDLIEQMARRWQKTTQERLYERMTAMSSLKEREARASQARMAPLLEAEQRRQEALAVAQAAQRQRDRQLLTWGAVMILVFVVFVVIVAVLTLPGG